MCLSLSMTIQKNFKNFKISSQHPYQELLEVLATLGACRGLEEALFPTPDFYRFSTNSSKLLRNFVSKMSESIPQEFRNPPSHLLYTLLCASQRPKNSTISPKIFRQLSTRLYRTCRQDLTLGANICKRVHSNTSLEGSPSLPGALKMYRAKQLQARMHVDANIHSWEYNKPACQTLIFLSVQISTQL